MGAPQFMVRTATQEGLGQFLPDFQSLDISPVFSQPGTVVIHYPENGVNFHLLVEDTELAITLNGVEIGGLRCMVEQIEGDDVNEASDGMVWTFTCRTTLALLDRAVVYPQNWPSANPPSGTWTGVTCGKLIGDLVSKAQARGALTGITVSFTDTHDSAGNAWTQTIDTISFDAGTKYSDVVQNLVDAQYIDVSMDRFVLNVFNAGGIGTDKSTGETPLRFQAGRDIKESPRKISTRDLATSLLVAGTDGVYQVTQSDLATKDRWGTRESYWSANNSKVPEVLQYFGQVKLATLDRPILEVTHGLFFSNEANPQPIRDFDIGDWGLSNVGRGWERYRIKQWVVSVDNQGVISGSVTLNDLIAEQIEKVNARLGRLENGTSEAGSSEEKDDGKAPGQVQGVSVATDYYLDHAQARAFITVTWLPVTENADGSDAGDISYYLARWRYLGSSDWQPSLRVDADTLTGYFAGIFTNQQVEVQVQAVDKYNHAGAWSISAVTTTAKDTTAPNKPSIPVVTSNVGTLRVFWDGKDFEGNPMPADFVGVEVHIGTDGVFTPNDSTLKDFLPSATNSATTITGLTYGTDWFARLVAIDTSGNRSDPSDSNDTSHAVLTQVVSTEIGTGQVGLNNTAFSDVGNLIDDGNFEISSYRVARQNLLSANMAFDSSTSSVGGWSLRSDANASGPLEYFTLQDSLPVKPGERIFGALDMRATSDAVGTVNLDIGWYDNTGALIGGSFHTLGGLSNATKDNTWHSRITGNSQVAPATAASMKLIYYTSGRTTGTVWVDAIEVRRQVDTLLIQDAAITNAKIGLLAVNDANIANASIGKLITGTLGADMVVGARIKTADTGARVELNNTGLKVFNSGGTQTGSFSSGDGSISITGTLKSGSSGTRIEVNPSGLPTIRLYSGAGTEYGYVNGFTLSGTDVGVGFNSSPFSGNGTQLGSRLVAFPGSANLEVIKSSDQSSSGGYVRAFPNVLQGGYYNTTQGGNFFTDSTDFYASGSGSSQGYLRVSDTFAKFGIRESNSNENSWYFESGLTRHYGKWENFVFAANNQGVHMGQINVDAGFSSTSVTYGPTMLSAMHPVATVMSARFDDTTGTNTTSPIWGVCAGMGSTTSFSVGWDKGASVFFSWWSFRA